MFRHPWLYVHLSLLHVPLDHMVRFIGHGLDEGTKASNLLLALTRHTGHCQRNHQQQRRSKKKKKKKPVARVFEQQKKKDEKNR